MATSLINLAPGLNDEPGTSQAAGCIRDRLEPLVGPLGVLDQPTVLTSAETGSLTIGSCQAGDTARALDEVAAHEAVFGRGSELGGAGGDDDPDLARWTAVAEALERYCSVVQRPDQVVTATRDELGDSAIDLTTLPQLSQSELELPGQTIQNLTADAPLRWARAVRLSDAEPVWIPARLIWLYQMPGEGQDSAMATNSTGCAIHSDPDQALVNAVLEVVERDAIALLWRQALPLPEIEIDVAGSRLSTVIDTIAGAEGTLRLFDATLDVGVPTLYAVHSQPRHPRLSQIVGCASHFDPQAAAFKAAREALSCRLAVGWTLAEKPGTESLEPSGFFDVMHGAAYMAAPERSHAFDFLTGPRPAVPPRRLSQLPCPEVEPRPRPQLRWLLGRLARLGLDSYAVDLTTDEAREVGYTAVKVVIPGLQPVSFVTAAQYLGSPRLYQAPAACGYPVRLEPDLNPWPQPFA